MDILILFEHQFCDFLLVTRANMLMAGIMCARSGALSNDLLQSFSTLMHACSGSLLEGKSGKVVQA